MSGLSEVENRAQEELARRVETLLSKNPTGVPSVPTPGQLSIFVRQNAHGLTRGKAAYLPTNSSSWVLLTTDGTGNWVTPGEIVLWGIVDRARTNSFTIVVSGEAVIPGAALTPGAHYFFEAGVPVALTAITNRQVPQMLLAQAIDATHVFVQSCAAVQNQYTQDAIYEHVTLANSLGAVVGDFLAINNAGSYVLALSDPANPDKANIHGCLVYDLGPSTGSSENFLMACEGWADIDESGDITANWPVSNSHPARYLSSTTAGKTVDVAPALPVLACYGRVTYNAGTGRSSGNLRLAGPGRTDPLALPIGLAQGGTGADFTSPAVPANAVIVMNAAATHLASVLNSGGSAFLTQGSSGTASWTTPDATVFQITGGALKLKDGTVLGQFLRWSGTAWTIYGPLMSTLGQVLSHDGADLVTVDASTALSVLGNATNAAAVPATIAAASADTLLGRRGTALTFAKVARAEMADGTACSVLGRSANSSGVLADIAAGSDGLFLTRAGGVLTWAAFPGGATVDPDGTVTTYTSTTTGITLTAGKVYTIYVISGGGGGGGGYNAAVDIYSVVGGGSTVILKDHIPGGGGSSGGVRVVTIYASANMTIDITAVGSAGNGGTTGAPASSGANGGTTTILIKKSGSTIQTISVFGGIGGTSLYGSAPNPSNATAFGVAGGNGSHEYGWYFGDKLGVKGKGGKLGFGYGDGGDGGLANSSNGDNGVAGAVIICSS